MRFKNNALLSLFITATLSSGQALAIVGGASSVGTSSSDPVSFTDTVNSVKNSSIGQAVSGAVSGIGNKVSGLGTSMPSMGSVTNTFSGGSLGSLGSSVTGGGSTMGAVSSIMGGGSTSSGISSVTSAASYTDVGSIVTGYCSTTMPIATSQGMTRGFSTLESAIGNQISNATAILSNTIQENIAKASQANTEALKGQSEQDKKVFESQLTYEEQQAKALQLVEAKKEIAKTLDIDKLNTTNSCFTAGDSHRFSILEKHKDYIANSATQIGRNLNNGLKSTSEVGKVYDEVIVGVDGKNKLDDTLPASNMQPKAITEDQAAQEIKVNAVIANPSPSPEIPKDNKKMLESDMGKQYQAAKALVDKKAEVINYVLNEKTAMETATVEPPKDNRFIMEELSKDADSGMKDKDGNPIMVKQIVDGKTSESAFLNAQVKQYHANKEWQSNLNTLEESTKLSEIAKILALNLDISHRVYKQLVIANQLQAYAMQKDMQQDGQAVQQMYDNLQSRQN